ncbi:aspartate/glutamate racemase family protein [Ornithinibacillus halotolerans]|uniref:Hydantoin racemase n=1 Tax=Ornithinibacillus halotolerans TaxID=1274357 RepID=A0A916SB50_9BACI|nr:aspartate/glutamate racemase family protein [Ornithinibacillus halotolerans]GGA91365.1 hydantoin racemase [Ornithinibacillus halotolerans]
MIGIIRVLTTNQEDVLQEHGKRLQELYHLDSISRCIPSQPNGIYDDSSEEIAIPKIIELAKQMEDEGKVDVLTISCAADPALEEARRNVNIPVLGAGVCGAHAASMVGSKVGIIGITDKPPLRMKQELGEKYYSYSFSPTLRKTTDLFREDAKAELLRLVQNVVDTGADTILFACTGFSTIRLKDYLANQIAVPVIDLVEAQGIAYQIIKGGKQGEQ